MKRAILLGAFAALCGAQTTVNGGRDYKGTLKASGSVSAVDFSNAGGTAPVKSGSSTSRPAACAQGQIYFATDVAAGQNLYFCTVTGTPGVWTQMSGNGTTAITAGTGAPAGNCSPPALYTDTDNQDLWYCGAANSWKRPAGGASGGSVNTGYVSSLFTGPDSTRTVSGATHGFATTALVVAVYDNASPRNAINVNYAVNPSTYDVTITFASPQSSYYVTINGGVGPQGPKGDKGDTGAAGGGTPGGISGQVQVNSGGTFAGQTSIFTNGTPVQRAVECASGTTSYSALTAAAASQEVTIQTGISGNVRWDQVTVSETTQFTGTTGLTVSVGRPGTNNQEMTGAQVPLMVSGGDANFWTARPIPPQLSGTYSIVLNFAVTSGTVNTATAGAVTWELCGYSAR